MPRGDDAVKAGRGFLLIAGAKAYFIVSSALIALGLPRFLGSPERFGEYKVVNSFISVLNMVLIVGTIQAVAKLVSEDPSRARRVRRVALRTQAMIGGAIALTVIAAAGPLSELLFRDAGLASYLRIGAGVTFLYAIYAVFVGTLNGLERFGHQALLDIVFSTLKVSLIVGLVLLGFGVTGAFVGFVTAAAITVVVAALVAGRDLPAAGPDAVPTRQLLTLLVPILGSTLMINLMLQIDVLGIKGVMHGPIADELRGGSGGGDIAGAAREATNRLAGLFGGAKNVALLPYQATFALTFIVFPLLSRSTFAEDRERSASYVRQAIRLVLLLASAAAVVLVAVARPLLVILMGPEYAVAAGPLTILLFSTVLMATLALSVTILNAAGRERAALLAATFTVVANASLLFVLLRTAPDNGHSVLIRAALATLGAVTLGTLATTALVWRRFGAFAPIWTVFRLIVVGGAIVGLARLWPVASLGLLFVKAAVVGLAFIGGMLALGELTASDRSALGRIAGRRAK